MKTRLLGALAWISTDEDLANASPASSGHRSPASGCGRYPKGCTDKPIARSLFADDDKPGQFFARPAGDKIPLFTGLSVDHCISDRLGSGHPAGWLTSALGAYQCTKGRNGLPRPLRQSGPIVPGRIVPVPTPR